MKKARIINAALWGILAAIITPTVCVVWHNQNCGVTSLIAAIVFYLGSTAALWYSIDQEMQGK